MKEDLIKCFRLIQRNVKLYFKDKIAFFVSLITPLILIVLFLTFLRQVYANTLLEILPKEIEVKSSLVNAFTGSWLFSSILSVSSVTVAFCCNMMVSDKLSGANLDFSLTPVKNSVLNASYVLANFCVTFLIMLVVLLLSFLYLAIFGFYLSFYDVVMILLSVVLSTMFGSLFASFAGLFIKSAGVQSGVSAMVSSMYGFLCGAYMPISSFGEGMRNFVSLLLGTYETVLFRKFYLNGIVEEIISEYSLPSAYQDALLNAFDGNLSAFGKNVGTGILWTVVLCSIFVLFLLYLLLSIKRRKSES